MIKDFIKTAFYTGKNKTDDTDTNIMESYTIEMDIDKVFSLKISKKKKNIQNKGVQNEMIMLNGQYFIILKRVETNIYIFNLRNASCYLRNVSIESNYV